MKDWQQRLMGKEMTDMCGEKIQIKEIHVLKTNKNNTRGEGGFHTNQNGTCSFSGIIFQLKFLNLV